MRWCVSRGQARRLGAALLACATAVCAASCSKATPAGAARPKHTGSPTTSFTTPPVHALPSKPEQIGELTQALRTLQKIQNQTLSGRDIDDYQVGQLWRRGIDGAGTTVAVIEGWDDPSISHEVAIFDRAEGLPDPQISTIYPVGLPQRCPPGMVKLGSYGSCAAWGQELALDVIAAHLIAPYARILIVVAPADNEVTDDAASQVAPPEFMKAVEYVASRHLANVISISDGTGESSYSHGVPEILAQDPGELAAAAAGIPLLVSTGDCGVVQNLPAATGQCEDTTSFPDSGGWDDSPWVTAVGGAIPHLNSKGQRLGPDQLWPGSGAGLSKVFRRPGYQDRVNTGGMRSVPDLVMDGQDGTSESAPLLAGVLALATQLNGGNVGPINPVLYGILGPQGTGSGVVDVTSGSDPHTMPDRKVVPGFTARRGFDIASGWGTVNAALFVPSLVTATRADGQEATARRQAAAELSALEHAIAISGTSLTAGGFLPGHPVRLSIDGKLVTTLTANARGSVSYRLRLTTGRHAITLTSMLLTQTGVVSG